MKWPYSDTRANEHPCNKEPATEKQVWYIIRLSEDRRDKDELINSIMDSIPGDLDIEDLTKGQASFVIKCMLGEIQPLEKLPLDNTGNWVGLE